ncbi:MAG: histidine triad nucleotide-binding protein [Chloroflexota bacterium]
MEATDCIFCRIISGAVPADFLHNDDLVVAIADLHPKAPTHILLMPREHVVSAADLTDANGPMLGRLFAVAAQLALDAGLADSGYRLVTNSGKGAGQSVPHLHFHLLGGRSMRWPPG